MPVIEDSHHKKKYQLTKTKISFSIDLTQDCFERRSKNTPNDLDKSPRIEGVKAAVKNSTTEVFTSPHHIVENSIMDKKELMRIDIAVDERATSTLPPWSTREVFNHICMISW